MLQFRDIMLGEHGDCSCRHCQPSQAVAFRDLTDVLADVQTAAQEWPAGPGLSLALTGAEPLEHPDLARIYSACTEAGAERVRLNSTCAALTSPAVVDDALRSGVRHLRFTLLGSDARLHDALLGVVGAYDATTRGIASFIDAAAERALAVHVSAIVPVCRHNLSDLPAIAAKAAELGAVYVLVRVEDPRLELSSAAAWVSSACDTGVLGAVWVEVEGVPVCHADSWELHLASNYRTVAGSKGPACMRCPLDGVCSGAAPGAHDAVIASLRPPANAEVLAARIRRGFDSPAASHA